jgi:hypothetical protein
MALERIELRLSRANPEERALIEALEQHSGEYGAMGRFLKTRLLRGYVAFAREVQAIRRESDPLAALDRLAQSINSGHYRVLRALLYPQTVCVQEPDSPPADNKVVRMSLDRTAHASDPPAPEVLPDLASETHSSATTALAPDSTNCSTPANWSAFAAIAGTKG